MVTCFRIGKMLAILILDWEALYRDTEQIYDYLGTIPEEYLVNGYGSI